MVILFKKAHPWNAHAPISINPSDSETVTNPEPENVCSSIILTVEGMVRCFSDLQLRNAQFPISNSPSESLTHSN